MQVTCCNMASFGFKIPENNLFRDDRTWMVVILLGNSSHFHKLTIPWLQPSVHSAGMPREDSFFSFNTNFLLAGLFHTHVQLLAWSPSGGPADMTQLIG